MTNSIACFLCILLCFSCSKDDQKVVSDDFFFFKSTINTDNYQTNGYMYADNSGHNGPQIWIRKTVGDSIYVNVSVQDIIPTLPPFQAGNINAYFYLIKKGNNLEGSYSLDKINYTGTYLIPGTSTVMFVDTTSSFNFVISDSSTQQPHGAYGDGAYNFTVLRNGVKVPVSGNFRLKFNP